MSVFFRHGTSQGPGGGFEATRNLARWLLISSAIGVVAGLGAVAFSAAIDGVTRLTLGPLTGFLPPVPAGEGGGWSAACSGRGSCP